ncbi:MAG: replication restart helicase PriA, partial [Candidatus Adiutrix sp.]
MSQLIAQVAVSVAAPEVYSYLVPPFLAQNLEVGQLVLVPLSRRECFGYVLEISAETSIDPKRLKPIKAIAKLEALFGPSLSRLINFISSYYLYPPGLCAKEILPLGLAPKLEKSIILKTDETLLPPDEIIGATFELWARLKAAHPTPLSINNLEKEGFGGAIKKMLSLGRIMISYQPVDKGPKAAYEWWLGEANLPQSPTPRLGPKERQLWEMVSGGPPKPLSYFASYIKSPLAQAHTLTAKGLTQLFKKEIFRDDPNRAIFDDKSSAPQPTIEQAQALNHIEQALNTGGHFGFLLFGITGSGKTEVYLKAAQKTLAMGKEVLWLTPEIALTMGLEGLLKNRCGAENLAVLHSGLTAAQRHDQWVRIRRGGATIVLGARSCVFAPLENLGLVVVDEEHDWAYKQDEGLCYNGRDLAMWRAKEAGATLILGSATPSLESYNSALTGRLKLLEMRHRTKDALLPQVEIIDQRQQPSRFRETISPALKKKLGETLARGEQALLFINRRGISNLPMCLACGEVLKCPHCSRSLTLHNSQGGFSNSSEKPNPSGPENGDSSGSPLNSQPDGAPPKTLICHSCGYRADPPNHCPKCLSPLFRYFGVGTEKLLQMAETQFPNVRGGRLDADSVRKRGGLKQIIKAFAAGEL